jgi:hypothetical protein
MRLENIFRLSKEDRYKIRLIKKYARIRFRRFKGRFKKFWDEWGISKEEFGMIITVLLFFVFLFELYIVGCMFI